MKKESKKRTLFKITTVSLSIMALTLFITGSNIGRGNKRDDFYPNTPNTHTEFNPFSYRTSDIIST